MLELFSSGLISVWLDMAGMPSRFASNPLATWRDTPWIVLTHQPDPEAGAIVQQYLKDLQAKGFNPQGQGVWLQSGSHLLWEHQGKTPLSAASLTKVATSLAALKTWGPDYQFETLVSATGPIQNGVLRGDLIIQGSGDPFFVWEEAIVMGNALNKLGIQQVAGNLVIQGKFAMNYEGNPMKAGMLLKEGLDSSIWSEDAAYQHATLPAGTPRPQVKILGTVQRLNIPQPKQFLLLRHRSLPLSQILKLMNIFSNNLIAEMLADSVGGSQVVAQQAAQAGGIPVSEIQLINGSGLGQENRISGRAACAMFVAIQRLVHPYGLTVADLFPVSGRDGGTLDYRKIPAHAAVKTGTLWDVSALAGAVPTRDRGLVWFAILNRGADLDSLRTQQDLLLQRMQQQWGTVQEVPSSLQENPQATPEDIIVGDPRRIQRLWLEVRG